jgi:hypothetical protein
MRMFRRVARLLQAHAAKIVIVAFLALPLLATVLSPLAASGEQRDLAPAPGAPASWHEALAWPAAADEWSNDHFGWRNEMVALYARLRHDLFGRFPTNQVMAGRGGRIFLAAHNQRGRGEPYTALIACGWQFKDGPHIISDFNHFARVFRASGIDAKLLVVPSGPVVYSEQLQEWQAERCRPEAVPANTMLRSPVLQPDARRRIYFPLAEMRAMRDRVEFFPKTFFHWGGSGAQAGAALAEDHFWRRGPDFGKPIPLVAQRRPSDIQFLFPGIEHDSVADEPDFRGTTITPCFGPGCFGDLKPVMEKLAVVGRLTNSAPGLGPRLVLVTDSFGYAGAPPYARYHREVVYVSSNSLARLNDDELGQLRSLLFRPGSADQILFLYHDATVYFGRVGTDLALLRPELARAVPAPLHH